MHREHHRAHLLRISLATAAAVLACTTLGACERDRTHDDRTTTTTAGLGQPQPELGRADEPRVQPTPGQQPTTTPPADRPPAAVPPTAVPERDDDVMARQEMMATRAQQACPMLVEDAKVEVEDTANGVALRFTTASRENVGDLRARVERLSRMYGAERGEREMMWQHMGHRRAEGDRPGKDKDEKDKDRKDKDRKDKDKYKHEGPAGSMPAATANVEIIEDGARLLLTPAETTQLATLREHVRHHQKRMSGGECWWVPDAPTGEGA